MFKTFKSYVKIDSIIFRCLCRTGWFGPVCALRQNPCDSVVHNCSYGSTCVPLESGYTCDCPLGRTGEFCEKSKFTSSYRA